MNFDLNYDKQPIGFLKKQDRHLIKRLLEKIENLLAKNLVPHDAKSIVGKHNCFRIRIGGYRALYRINYKESKIIIYKLDKRGKVFN